MRKAWNGTKCAEITIFLEETSMYSVHKVHYVYSQFKYIYSYFKELKMTHTAVFSLFTLYFHNNLAELKEDASGMSNNLHDHIKIWTWISPIPATLGLPHGGPCIIESSSKKSVPPIAIPYPAIIACFKWLPSHSFPPSEWARRPNWLYTIYPEVVLGEFWNGRKD